MTLTPKFNFLTRSSFIEDYRRHDILKRRKSIFNHWKAKQRLSWNPVGIATNRGQTRPWPYCPLKVDGGESRLSVWCA